MNHAIIDKFEAQWGFLSNFFPSPLWVKGFRYETVEHAFQALKMTTQADHEAVRAASTPGIAKKLARSKPRREDWEQVKDSVMLYCLRQKFLNRDLEAGLLSTEQAVLIEGNTWGDRYWGQCDGKGQNKLGYMLMMVRSEIRERNILQVPV